MASDTAQEFGGRPPPISEAPRDVIGGGYPPPGDCMPQAVAYRGVPSALRADHSLGTSAEVDGKTECAARPCAGPAPPPGRSDARPIANLGVADPPPLPPPGASERRAWRARRRSQDSYLVDSASSHMLVSKIKPCMSKYKQPIL